jgi:hypothetical protein
MNDEMKSDILLESVNYDKNDVSKYSKDSPAVIGVRSLGNLQVDNSHRDTV